MDEGRIETTTGMCVVALTKHLMKKQNIDYETAYKKLLTTELYKLLLDSETRLFLENEMERLFHGFGKRNQEVKSNG